MFHFKISLFGILYILVAFVYGTNDPNNYGPYDVEWEHYDICRGPKLIDIANLTTRLEKYENKDYKAKMNITFFDTTSVDEIRITVYTLKENKKTLLWTYNVNKPCKHFVLEKVLTNVGLLNCKIKKGFYPFDFNLTQIMRNYMGNSFFYGQYWFKVVVTSKKGNIGCLIFDPSFVKVKT